MLHDVAGPRTTTLKGATVAGAAQPIGRPESSAIVNELRYRLMLRGCRTALKTATSAFPQKRTFRFRPIADIDAGVLSRGMAASTIHAFLNELNESRIHYSLSSVREGAVMVHVALPGERWEIEFFEDRDLEVEIFRSDGTIGGPEMVQELLRDAAD
jgi:hypothetical protein